MTAPADFNQQIIAELRTGGGESSSVPGWPLLLLHHKGRTSGTERIAPLVYQQVGDGFAVFGSKGGSDEAPDWYLNLIANPDATIEVKNRTVAVRARDLPAEERAPIWEEQKKAFPNFAEYEANTKRTIPVVLLEPTS